MARLGRTGGLVEGGALWVSIDKRASAQKKLVRKNEKEARTGTVMTPCSYIRPMLKTLESGRGERSAQMNMPLVGEVQEARPSRCLWQITSNQTRRSS